MPPTLRILTRQTMWAKLAGLIAHYPLDFISYVAGIIPVLAGFVWYNRLTASMKWVVALFGLFFLKDSVGWVHSLRQETNLYLINLQSFAEIGAVGIIYALSLPRFAKLIGVLAIGCLLLNSFYYSNVVLSVGNLTIARLFILVVVLIYLAHVLNEAVIRNILAHDLFWLSAGLLVYAAGTFFIFLFGQYLFDSATPDATFDFYWSLQEIIYIIFSALAALGLYVSHAGKPPESAVAAG